MAEDDLDDEVDAAAEKATEEARAAATRSAGKGRLMTMLFVAGALVVGLLGGGAGGYLVGSAAATAPGHQEQAAAGHGAEAEAPTPSIYVGLPKIRTNIASARCRGLYIDLEVTAAVGSEEEAAVLRAAADHIKDGMTEYARTVTKEDLEGREGSERLRTNVQAVIDNAIQPARVREVLFKEFVLQ